jgi:hypothetical protein
MQPFGPSKDARIEPVTVLEFASTISLLVTHPLSRFINLAISFITVFFVIFEQSWGLGTEVE